MGRGTGVRAVGDAGPYGSNAGSVRHRADVDIGPYALRGTGDGRRGTARRVVVPYGWLWEVSAIALGSWRIAERLRRRGRGRERVATRARAAPCAGRVAGQIQGFAR